MTFEEILKKYPRVAIAGGPKAGKTTLSETVTDRPVIHSDSYMKLEWSEGSRQMAEDVNAISGPVVVEGVSVPRSLRKHMQVDVVVWLRGAHEPLSKGQAAMAKAVRTVLDEWHYNYPLIEVVEL